MTDATEGSNVRGPPTIKTLTDLETRLSESPTLETDVMDFLLIAGFGYRSPIYGACTNDLQELLRERYHTRRAGLDRRTRVQETLLQSSLREPYYEGTFRTLYDLKHLIERRGTAFRHFGPGSLATLNAALQRYDLGPFTKLGKYRQPRPYSPG